MSLSATIGEKLHDIIREDILSGRYAPNERLFFDKIAEENHVSMTPIKEAFLKLESENLVVTIPRRGTFVKKLSANEIKEYYQIRLAMENLAVELILKNGFSEDFEKKMLATCDSLESHSKSKNAKECVKDDIKFHSLLIEASNNKKLFHLIKTIPLTNLFNFSDDMSNYMINSPSYICEHRKIIKLLKQKKSEEIKEILTKHISFTK
ncbi:GntR family transcriptional regulator [Treponema parvum]|uniref:GntR family transcriptional regulator n=1 Tax=Treponema parvum TaxID=138851 RepID=A0A975ICJ5_9SPIR|nr:GntR family transcriptional regulator [Treponema parvum]QTQ11970.1 GntR family transcriptional regulator [Treponema parvum]QTQ16052.1 GntR family transcriptional regulator [Treponema parvum]